MAINYSLRDVAYAFKHLDESMQIHRVTLRICSWRVDRYWYNDTVDFISYKQIVAFIGTGQAREHDNKNLKG